MNIHHELARSHEKWHELIAFAISEGWQVKRLSGGRVILSKPGSAAIYTGTALKEQQAKHALRRNQHG